MRARWELLSEISDNLYVLFITDTDAKCPLPGGATLKLTAGLTLDQLEMIKTFIGKNNITTSYFSYDQFGVIADHINCKKVLEIYDVLHLRQKKFEEFGYEAPYKVEKEVELEGLKRYDFIACLNLSEVEYLCQNSVSNAVYLPPNIPFAQTLKNKNGLSAGMIASMAKPNTDGLHHALDHVKNLPHLVFAGPICNDESIKNLAASNITKMGIVSNVKDFYASIDVALSPPRFGGGLKIKVFEALAHGKPVIASSHSAEGFPAGIEKIISIENDFSKWDSRLLEQTSKIKSSEIEEYFQSNFSRKICSDILRNIT
jgi:glycosyltransferase involved in cell wall biosynthesis